MNVVIALHIDVKSSLVRLRDFFERTAPVRHTILAGSIHVHQNVIN